MSCEDELNETKRKLWLSRANSADAWSRVWMHRTDYNNNFEISLKWNKVEDICRKKAKEYERKDKV